MASVIVTQFSHATPQTGVVVKSPAAGERLRVGAVFADTGAAVRVYFASVDVFHLFGSGDARWAGRVVGEVDEPLLLDCDAAASGEVDTASIV